MMRMLSPVANSAFRWRYSSLVITLFLSGSLLFTPFQTVDAELTSQSERLYPVCTNPDLCQLSDQTIGEAMIEGSTQSATPATPVTVRQEFTMLPTQGQLAMLPINLDEMLIDLRIREDPTMWSQPDLVVDLRLGDSWNQWTIEGGGFGLPEAQQPYSISDAALDFSNGRILRPNDPVILTLSFRIDRPVTWELHLAGNSWFDLPIEWSLDADAVNVDEPSSMTEPRAVEPSRYQYGALISGDIDCFSFTLPEDLDAFTVHIQWDVAPIEIEQSHKPPTMETETGLSNPAPQVTTTVEAGETRSEIRWAQPRGGEQHLCWVGEHERYQAYAWLGRQTKAGIGATSPDDFTGIAAWPTGSGWSGITSDVEKPDSQGGGLLLVGGFFAALGGIAMILPSGAWWTRRIAIPFALVLILAGGVASPAWALTSSMPKSGEMELEDYLSAHVAAVSDSVLYEDPVTSAGFLGTTSGDVVKLRLHITGAHPTEDGRWQLHAKEIEGLRIDEIIYSELETRPMGEFESVQFMLRAGRQLAFDLLMLEALLVVDKEPAGNVLHIEWNIVAAKAAGSETNPVWTTRPMEVSEGKWNHLVRDIYPELMSISYCDCGLDSLDISLRKNPSFDSTDLSSTAGMELSEGLFPFATILLGIGVLLLGGSQIHSRVADREARQIAEELGRHLDQKELRRRREELAAVAALASKKPTKDALGDVGDDSDSGEGRTDSTKRNDEHLSGTDDTTGGLGKDSEGSDDSSESSADDSAMDDVVVTVDEI